MCIDRGVCTCVCVCVCGCVNGYEELAYVCV